MGTLNRLLGMAARALDLDESGSRQPRADSRAGATPTPAPGRREGAHDPYSPPPAEQAHRGEHSSSPSRARRSASGSARSTVSEADRAAIARYDYLLETADPHRVEQIHREAFSRLTPDQRALVQERMNSELAPGDRPASASPHDLARAAGRTEAARPGRMRGLLSRVGRGGAAVGVGGAAVGVGGAAVGVLGVVAVGAAGSAVAAPLLEQAAGLGVDFDTLAQGIDVESIASGLGGEEIVGAAEGFVGAAGETASGLGDSASEWGQRLGDLGIPGIGDLFGR